MPGWRRTATQSKPWETLLRWWHVEHEILMAVVDRIPEERLEARCVVGDDEAPVTLRFLIEDYVTHQQWSFQSASGILIAPADGKTRTQKGPAHAPGLWLLRQVNGLRRRGIASRDVTSKIRAPRALSACKDG